MALKKNCVISEKFYLVISQKLKLSFKFFQVHVNKSAFITQYLSKDISFCIGYSQFLRSVLGKLIPEYYPKLCMFYYTLEFHFNVSFYVKASKAVDHKHYWCLIMSTFTTCFITFSASKC